MNQTPVPRWDVIIIGGGPAGLSAAVLLARMKRAVLLFDAGEQRNRRSHGMHNYLTRDGILPPDFLTTARDEALHYGATLQNRTVVSAEQARAYHFRVTDSAGQQHESRRLLLATGVQDCVPDIPGMHELWGCAVHHCPYCDGPECCGYTVGLYASKNNGYGEALALRQLGDNVILFTDNAYKLKPAQRAHLEARNIRVEYGSIDRLDFTGPKLNGVVFKDGRTVACQKMFVNHGLQVQNTLLKQLGCRLVKNGASYTDRKQQTSVPGVYAAGDADLDIHFVIVAAAEGAKAGTAIHTDLMNWDNRAALAVKDSG